MPRQQPAAAERRDDRVDVGQVLEDLEPAVPLPAMKPIVVERMHEVASPSAIGPCCSTVRQHSS